MFRRSLLILAGTALSRPSMFALDEGTIELQGQDKPDVAVVRGNVRLKPGTELLLRHTTRPTRLVFDCTSACGLTAERGARVVIEGSEQAPVEIATQPVDPATKPVLELQSGSRGSMRHASLVNVALRVEGQHHELSHVSVQYAGDQPCFTFVGARGSYSRLFAHHGTWGFSFEPLEGRPCELGISDSTIRSCAKGGGDARYQCGGSLRALSPLSRRNHQIRMDGVDWDSTWDHLEGASVEARGARPRIVALGDSIVQGSPGYVNFWNYIPGNDDLTNSWPYLLGVRAPQFFVVNRGEGGFITSEMLNRLPGIIAHVKPQYCFLGGGTNNLETLSTPAEVFRDFVKMWDMLQVAGIVPVQLAITPTSRSSRREERIVETNHLIRNACMDRSLRFEDAYGLLVSASGRGLAPEYSADGLHLNKAGYQALAQSLLIPPLRNVAP